MKKFILFISALLFFTVGLKSQESILLVKNPYIVKINAETGDVEDEQFIDLSPAGPSTPKGVEQVGNEIWVTDQVADAIFRFDLDGTYISSISGGMDNIKGLGLVNNSEVWVTNAGDGNGAPGDAIVKFDTSGNPLGHFTTNDMSSFDVLDDRAGNVYISYISGGSPMEIRDYDGEFVDYFIPPYELNFLEQMWITADGNMLFTAFSSPAGIYLYDLSTGNQLNYWSQSLPRGVIETGDGSILWTSSSGLFRMNPTTGISTELLSGNCQFFGMLNAAGSDCTPPTLDVTDSDPICEGESAVITAATNGDKVNWYDSASSTTPVHTGLEFTTPALSATTSYWAEAEFVGGEVITGGARIAPTSTTNSAVVPATSPWGLSFDTDEDFTIDAVDVYLAGAAGDLVMELLDENWQLLEQTTVSCPPGNSSSPVQFEVPLNFEVEAGKTYRLVASASPDMVREFSSAHPGFPYPIGSVGTVTGGTINNSDTNNTVYYFFYNWTVSTGSGEEACVSDRVETVVTVNPQPDTPSGEADQYFTQGQTLDDLEVDATGDLTWYADEDGNTELPSNTELVDETTYYVSQTIDGCESELFAITVHLILNVNDLTKNDFTVYPNPVTDILHIVSKGEIRNAEIYDAAGRKLARFNDVKNHQIDLRSLPQGTYILRINTGKEIKSVKITKK